MVVGLTTRGRGDVVPLTETRRRLHVRLNLVICVGTLQERDGTAKWP
jgi:hypothetical protein